MADNADIRNQIDASDPLTDQMIYLQNSANRHAGYRGGRHATSGANGTAQAGHYRTSRFGLGVLFVRPAGARSNG